MEGGSGGRPDDAVSRGAPRRAPWPTSAIVSVALCLVLVVLLAILNLLGVQVGAGDYRADVGGTAADWFSGVATLVALPVAVVLGLHQLRAQTEATALERQRAASERLDAQRLVSDAVDLDVDVVNLIDEPDLATRDESEAAARWRAEVRQRGWVPVGPDDAAGAAWERWRRDGRSLTNTELLAAESSSVLPQPFTLVARCRNGSGSTVVVERWTVRLGEGEAVDDARPQAIRRGEVLVRRLDLAGAGPGRYPTAAAAARAAEVASVVVEGADVLGRALRIEHPRARRGEPADAG
jgi:hypothetical protein